ncbi:MAG TPA: TIGR03435 family protein [Terriglobia bacterium]
MRAFASLSLTVTLAIAAFGQSAETPASFEIADIHSSTRTSTLSFMRTTNRPGRYELDNASMLELIRTAYTFDANKVVGGPTWLDYDRFDVIVKTAAKMPDAETLKLMLQNLLADRFKLVVHKDIQPVTGWVLAVGKGKHKLKESDGKGETGCKLQAQTSTPVQITGGVFNVPTRSFSCRNITMEKFAEELRGMAPGDLTNAVVDSTGLKGAWDFDLKWQQGGILQLLGASADVVTLPAAIDKQLGLKLDEQKIPTAVLVVDKVNEKPTDNAADIAIKLPPPPPVEFEVVDIKPSIPLTAANVQQAIAGAGRAGFFPGGRVNLPRFNLRTAILYAFNLVAVDDIANVPNWFTTTNFDIVAKAPAEVSPVSGHAPIQDLGPMLKAMLIDRFKLKAHFEDRPVNAYTLLAPKPKLKKADLTRRTGCKTANASNSNSNSSPFGFLALPDRIVTCQNITMAQFTDQLEVLAQNYVHYPVTNGTGLDGAWDFSFTYTPFILNQVAGARGAAPPGAGPEAPAAAEPGGGTTLFDAVDKQLGLKLEMQKHPYPILVIDHIEEKPTEN